jgi:hypothetical protein
VPADVGGVYIDGLKELRRALGQLDPEARTRLREELKAAGNIISRDVSRRVRADVGRGSRGRSTGRAASSVRAVSKGNEVYIVGGKATVPYYGWLDFGGKLKATGRRTNEQKRPVVKRGRYIYPAIDKNMPLVIAAAERAIKRAEGALDL